MTYEDFWLPLTTIYDAIEAKSIARMVFEVRYGLSWADLLAGKSESIDHSELEVIQAHLLSGEPVQYVLGEAEFSGRSFSVNKHVLIPRPETAELCRWIISSDSVSSPQNILDIGTGSGCIAITLAAEINGAQVTAWDVSAEALRVATENARRNHVSIHFQQVDILQPLSIPSSPFDLIVSNPPYICNKEREAMEAHVLDHEPHVALFVPDDDPLRFYRAIARYGQQALKDGGWLYFEINPRYATPLAALLASMSYRDIEVKNDSYGKQRMVRACKTIAKT